jgi:hypothetical protein
VTSEFELRPWRKRSDDDAMSMIRWVNARLDELKRNRLDVKARKDRTAFIEWQNNLGPEIETAENDGDVEPLRAKILERLDLPPDLAARISRCISVPPRRHGERRFLKFRRDRVIDWAALDVDRIRDIWRENYPDHKIRTKRDGPSAISIAATRWTTHERMDICEDDVQSRWKKLHEPSRLLKRKLVPTDRPP